MDISQLDNLKDISYEIQEMGGEGGLLICMLRRFIDCLGFRTTVDSPISMFLGKSDCNRLKLEIGCDYNGNHWCSTLLTRFHKHQIR